MRGAEKVEEIKVTSKLRNQNLRAEKVRTVLGFQHPKVRHCILKGV
jgi:hypothetical protein